MRVKDRVLKKLNETNDRRDGNRGRGGRSRVTAVLLTLCAVGAVVAGCSPAPESPELTDPQSDWQGGEVTSTVAPDATSDGVKNISMWALPLDEFVPKFGNVDNYAEQVLLAGCLDEAGMEWPVPWQDVEEPASPVFNPVGRRLFNLEIANKYGFRTNLAPSKSTQLWEEFLGYKPTEPGFQPAFDACLADIREEHAVLDTADTVLVSGLIAQIQEESFLSPEGQDAADRWRSCMQPQGLGELPENPNNFPSFELQEELGAIPPVKTVEPSARELEVAVAHATCLDSSGFSAAMYEMEWTLQATAIERDRANLDRVRDAVQDREAEVREIIAANAPRP